MNSHVSLFALVAALSLASRRPAHAQKPVQPTAANFHEVISLDRMAFQGMGASPDGRWITISAIDGGSPGIWILPADGHGKPTRLLSAGHADRAPIWFPSGSRLAFLSDRAARDGSQKTYVMTVEIDPQTGRAASPPRQISTEETPMLGTVSPDGKWIAYASPRDSLWKAVPSSGGTPRTLVKLTGAGGPMMWSRDGKTIFFALGTWGGGAPPYGLWYKVSLSGGPTTRAYQNPDAMPYLPNTDLHVVFVRRGNTAGGEITRVELYNAKEQLVGATDVPAGMALFFPRGATRGFYAAASSSRYENSLVTLNGGTTRTLVAPPYAWVNGWADNATLLIDGKDASGSFVATLDTAGREGRHVALPADARGPGWQGTVGFATAFRRGAPPVKPTDPNPFYIADARTGAITELAPNASGVGTDGDRFLMTTRNDQQLELRAVTVDKQSTLLRSFAKSENVVKVTAVGDLVAWAVPSKDSMTVFAARGLSGRPHTLTTVRFNPYKRFELQWSFDGTTLAVLGEDADPALLVIRVEATGAPRGVPVVLNPRATGLWSVRWTRDNRALVLLGTPTGAKDELLLRVPIDPAETTTAYGRNDEAVFVSPDGNRIAYPAVRMLGTTIWRVDFLPPTSTGASKKS